MTIENTEVEPEVIESTDDDSALSHLADKDRDEIRKLRKEAAERRVRAKELQNQLDAINNKLEKEKEAKLLEDGKLKELLEEKEKQINELLEAKKQNESYKQHFEEQLEAALRKLSNEQKELINDSGWSVDKKLKWALQLSDKKLSLSGSPDSSRPSGEPTNENIDINEYSGPEGRVKLIKLKKTNPKRYELIMKLKK